MERETVEILDWRYAVYDYGGHKRVGAPTNQELERLVSGLFVTAENTSVFLATQVKDHKI